MANYVTQTSDKSKRKALKLLLCGGIGLHLFYVGRIGAGIVRFIMGAAMWTVMLTSVFAPKMLDTEGAPVFLAGLLMLVIFNIVDLIKLLLGTFRDNVGAYLRA